MSETIVRKTYVCPIIGTGSTHEDRRRPKIADLPVVCSRFMHELTENWCLCTVVTTEANHATIEADPQVRLISVKKLRQIADVDWEQLKTQYPKLTVLLGDAKDCWIEFMGEKGE